MAILLAPDHDVGGSGGSDGLADCATASSAIAAIRDPSRPPSMWTQISDQADSYVKAALGSYRAATKQPAAKARASLKARVAKRTPDFSRQSRDAMDKFIDACPQTGD
jgi:hypothetical protein